MNELVVAHVRHSRQHIMQHTECLKIESKLKWGLTFLRGCDAKHISGHAFWRHSEERERWYDLCFTGRNLGDEIHARMQGLASQHVVQGAPVAELEHEIAPVVSGDNAKQCNDVGVVELRCHCGFAQHLGAVDALRVAFRRLDCNFGGVLRA